MIIGRSGQRSVLNLEAYKDKSKLNEVHKNKAQDYKDCIDYIIDANMG
jgi:hypothetical protein